MDCFDKSTLFKMQQPNNIKSPYEEGASSDEKKVDRRQSRKEMAKDAASSMWNFCISEKFLLVSGIILSCCLIIEGLVCFAVCSFDVS